MVGKLFLKRGKEKPLLHHHPWIFSGAIARVENANDGDTVDVYDTAGQWLARAAFNSRSQIAARVWTFEGPEEINREFFQRKIIKAIEARDSAISAEPAPWWNLDVFLHGDEELINLVRTNPMWRKAYRVVNAE